MRTPLRTLLALALLTVATGCGDSGSSEPEAGGAPSAAASPSPSPSPVAITKASATAAARKINLMASDLAGFTASPPDETQSAAEKAADKALNVCIGASTAEPVADVSSDDFTKGAELPSLQYSSQVSFVADAATVAKDVAALQGDKALPCIAAYVKKAIGGEEQGVTVAEPKTTRLTLAVGGQDAAGFRITSTITAGDQKIPLTFDLLAFGTGRTEVSLIAAGTGTGVPADQEQALFGSLVERATANAL